MEQTLLEVVVAGGFQRNLILRSLGLGNNIGPFAIEKLCYRDLRIDSRLEPVALAGCLAAIMRAGCT